jgi:hypothetical protein
VASGRKGTRKIYYPRDLMPKIFIKFQPLLGGHSELKSSSYEDHTKLISELNQKQIDTTRFNELVEQYYSTNDPDLRQNIASDLFREFGALVWA